MNTQEKGQDFEAQKEKDLCKVSAKERLIYQMLTENTGKSLCDSGDIYGRHWERNQNKSIADFKNEPSVTYSIQNSENKEDKTIKLEDIEYTISVFHYLKDSYLQIDPICNFFNHKFVPAKNWESENGYGLSSEGEEWLENWGFEFENDFNSSNYTDFLSQVLQGTFLNLPICRNGNSDLYGRRYVLLQVHQGCDIRGGYTDARLFYLPMRCLPFQSVHGDIKGVEFNNWEDGKTLKFEPANNIKITKDDVINIYYTTE